MGLKPIETKYKGYRFRSRLEARYAVLFEAMGFKWEYEKEGYQLPKLGGYLPDFYLTSYRVLAFGRETKSYDAIVEIKPFTPTDLEFEKMKVLAAQVEDLNIDCFICVGVPGEDATLYRIENQQIFASHFWDVNSPFAHSFDACKTAKSARFEHGETPHVQAKPKPTQPVNERERIWKIATDIEPRLIVLFKKAQALQTVARNSRRFCANEHWYGFGDSDGLKDALVRLVGWGAANDDLKGDFVYDVCYQKIWDEVPPCKRCSEMGDEYDDEILDD